MTIGPWWTEMEPFVIAEWVRYVIEPNLEGPLRAATQGIIWGAPGDSTPRVCIRWPNIRGIEIERDRGSQRHPGAGAQTGAALVSCRPAALGRSSGASRRR